jgi:predicted pyridoxine 5'-phosphate oxidase superfamily flavin-nucleotide-binding protein
MSDPRVALLFLIPGINETIRVNGTAEITVRPDLLARSSANGKLPKTVLIVHVREVFFQCAKALMSWFIFPACAPPETRPVWRSTSTLHAGGGILGPASLYSAGNPRTRRIR